MASKRRIRRKSCTGKVAYPTIGDAVGVKEQQRRAGAENLHVYKCEFCRHWHIGHIPRKQYEKMLNNKDGI